VLLFFYVAVEADSSSCKFPMNFSDELISSAMKNGIIVAEAVWLVLAMDAATPRRVLRQRRQQHLLRRTALWFLLLA
jgi:hypothetical protein